MFLQAGAAKIVRPGISAKALAEVLPLRAESLRWLTKLTAVAELATVLAVVLPPVRPAGLVLAGTLGLLFAVLGLAGLVTGSSEPCGCFGTQNGKPLGMANVLTGLVFVVVSAVSLWMGAYDETFVATTALLTTVFSAGWLMWANRGHLLRIIDNVRNREEPAG
nr:MauE/DoxX family redox-associated membrane protein [Fodinicola acaciae]